MSRALSSRPRSYSGGLSGPLALPPDGAGGVGRAVYPTPRRSVERLSATSSSPASLSGALGPPAECPNCKRERKIREEYDKFIVQARRDRDSLHQRVAELEARLLMKGAGREEEVEERKKEEKEETQHRQTEAEEEEEEEAMELSRCNSTEITANTEVFFARLTELTFQNS